MGYFTFTAVVLCKIKVCSRCGNYRVGKCRIVYAHNTGDTEYYPRVLYPILADTRVCAAYCCVEQNTGEYGSKHWAFPITKRGYVPELVNIQTQGNWTTPMYFGNLRGTVPNFGDRD